MVAFLPPVKQPKAGGMRFEEEIIQTTDHPAHSGYFDAALMSEIQKIPSKISFKIGEVARILNIKTHVLRYWELEFDSLKPQKMLSGQRLYLKKDVEMALLIKKLLYRDGFSVKGAKKALTELKREKRQYKKQSFAESKVLQRAREIQDTISTIRNLIK